MGDADPPALVRQWSVSTGALVDARRGLVIDGLASSLRLPPAEHAAKEKQSFNEGRIAEIESQLATAEIIDPSKLSGDRVVICEDTVTRGTSPLEAAAVVRELGAFPVAVMPVGDRGGTCGAAANEAGLDFRPLVTAPDLGFPYEGP